MNREQEQQLQERAEALLPLALDLLEGLLTGRKRIVVLTKCLGPTNTDTRATLYVEDAPAA